jgi:hypothetical protein
MAQTNRKDLAAVSAVLLWLALHALVAMPFALDPLAMKKWLPIYLGGVLVFLEPLICIWAYYQYRYMLRDKPESHHRDGLRPGAGSRAR